VVRPSERGTGVNPRADDHARSARACVTRERSAANAQAPAPVTPTITAAANIVRRIIVSSLA
jgi:hypothetical protein